MDDLGKGSPQPVLTTGCLFVWRRCHAVLRRELCSMLRCAQGEMSVGVDLFLRGGHAMAPPTDGSDVASQLARLLARLQEGTSPGSGALQPPVTDMLFAAAQHVPAVLRPVLQRAGSWCVWEPVRVQGGWERADGGGGCRGGHRQLASWHLRPGWQLLVARCAFHALGVQGRPRLLPCAPMMYRMWACPACLTVGWYATHMHVPPPTPTPPTAHTYIHALPRPVHAGPCPAFWPS